MSNNENLEIVSQIIDRCKKAIAANQSSVNFVLPEKWGTGTQVRLIKDDRTSPWGTVVGKTDKGVLAYFCPNKVLAYLEQKEVIKAQPITRKQHQIKPLGETPLTRQFGVRVTAKTAERIRKLNLDVGPFIREAIDSALNILEDNANRENRNNQR